MESMLKALDSIQTEIHANVASSSRPSSAPLASSSPIEKINDHLYEVRKPAGRPSVEFVFFHGLQPERSNEAFLTTWMSGGGTELWLNWLLKPFPQARILVVSYDASATKTDREGRMDKYVTCENLVTSLTERGARVGEDGCPVVLVGHCLGGLIMKQLCLHANYVLSLQPRDKPDEAIENLLRNIKGLFFYSTPHHGSRVADVNTHSSKGRLFEILTTLNTETARCNEEFRKLRVKYGWGAVGIGESRVVTLGEFKGFVVVEEASARHDVDRFYTIAAADHFNVCRPDSPKSGSFSMLSNFVTDLLKEAKGRDGPKSYPQDRVVGLEGQVQRCKLVLERAPRLGIVGMGGIGKTTLAEALYNAISRNFEYACFLREVKTYMRKRENPDDLRARIIGSLYSREAKVPDDFKWSKLKRKRVLIILDDAETEYQVDVMTEFDGFASDSRVIVTSRETKFLTDKNFECHPADHLDDEASSKLFCFHAFNCANPPSGYKEHVVRFVNKCQGLPLALEVAGKYLCNQPQGTTWDEVLEKLSLAESLDGKRDDGLWSVLRTSYDLLADSEREMFLDIAVCFHGQELEDVKAAWRVQLKAVDSKWQNLVDRNLVKTKSDNIQMHEALRDLGRSIACPDGENIAGHSRVLTNDIPDWPVDKGKLKVKVLIIDHFPSRSVHRTIDIESFQGLEELRILWLTGVNLQGPCHLLPRNLVFLKLDYGWWITGLISENLSTFPQKSRQHSTLRHLDFKFASPVFFPEFEEFYGPLEWRSLPDTIGNLQALEHLEIRNNRYMQVLPDVIGKLQALRVLKMECCALKVVPDAIGNLQALEYLLISNCPIELLPDDIRKLQALRTLEIRECGSLKSLPYSLVELHALKSFCILECKNLEPHLLHFTSEKTSIIPWRLILLHRKAMERVSQSDYKGVLIYLNSCNLEEREPKLQGFLLQERGIVKRFIEDLQGALQDLTAALSVFSAANCLSDSEYDCRKHGGFVKFLLNDLDGARNEGAMALRILTTVGHKNLLSPSLGDGVVKYMHFNLKGTKEFAEEQMDREMERPYPLVRERVEVFDFAGALSIWDAFDGRVSGYWNRLFFLQERGILKGLAGNLDGALEDLTAALEIHPDHYECIKHRGYVKFLLGDEGGARIDARRCLEMGRRRPSDCFLGTFPVDYLEFQL